MIRIKKLLCPVDFSSLSMRSLQYGIYLAKSHKAHLHLLHVIAPVVPLAPDLYVSREKLIAAFEKRAESEMQRLQKKAASAGVPVETEVQRGAVEIEIQEAVRSHKIDLVVMGRHGRPALERWFMGSVTERLLRRLPVPILVVGEGKTRSDVRRIVMATDFSAGAADALSYAVSLAQETGAALTLLHVMPKHTRGVGIPYDKPVNEVRAELDDLVSRTAQKSGRIVTKLESGVPYERILNFVKKSRANLLVMNIHGKTGLERALLGSTAERVIRGSPCPVLAVPPKKVNRRRKPTA